jgi:ABC-type dipeptide/oligopeptide/nickel transport system ATPase subunit
MADGVIAIRDLKVAFRSLRGSTTAVDGVSFQVPAGRSFGIVGESGSGKSTILRAITGLVRDWSGHLAIDGRVIGKTRSKEFYRSVQMVFQDPYASLHPMQTVKRILEEPLAIHGLGDRRARVERALADVGLGSGFLFRFPHQLSGGQRQRVAIARALIIEPRILLLDEPTSALDVSVQAEVLNLLAQLREERGLTYILVSHNLGVVAHLCDRIAVMRAGLFVEELTVEMLQAAIAVDPYTQQLLHASEGYVEHHLEDAPRRETPIAATEAAPTYRRGDNESLEHR